MKKILAILFTMGMCFSLCACNSNSADTKINSQFIQLQEWDSATGLCYDKDTKIIYIYSSNENYWAEKRYSYSPYYIIDTNNEPAIGVYNEDN